MELVPRKGRLTASPGQLHLGFGVTRSSSHALLQVDDLIKVVCGRTEGKDYFQLHLFTTLAPRIKRKVI